MLPPLDEGRAKWKTGYSALADLYYLVNLLVDVDLGLFTFVHLETNPFLSYSFGFSILLSCSFSGREVLKVIGILLVEGLDQFLASLLTLLLHLL